MPPTRVVRQLALALCLLLGWTMVQRGLFHRCVHVTVQAQGAPSIPVVKGICPVCDVMLPVFNETPSSGSITLTASIAEIGRSYVSVERFGFISSPPGRGPPDRLA
ncbi:MAG TPA: hypothetical protein VKG92_02315 [Flavobacteriales bacterium]|nr:hypothetical protein [Flavobacteriales bacterium]